MAAEKHFLANKVSGTLSHSRRLKFYLPTLIGDERSLQVVFHIFYDEKNPSDGYVRDSVIYKQMAVIEPFFEELGLNFNLKKINRRGIPNATFYGADIGNTAEATIKKYREGDVATLNIYTVGYVRGTKDVVFFA
ncbi:hypothetical protein C0991_010922 [Blastosporella zonata]|nr:hypothetical protein C0991_010922 [Blastosporella zonata]